MTSVLYKPGDVIQNSTEPFTKSVLAATKGLICDACFKLRDFEALNSLRQCCGCSHMYYCSKACQKKDWKDGHKLECGSKTFSNSFKKEDQDIRCQLIRLLAYTTVNPSARKRRLNVSQGESISFDDIMDQKMNSWVPPDGIEMTCEELALEIAEEDLDTGDILPNTNYFLHLLFIFHYSAVIIIGETVDVRLGSGMYIEMSGFKHSCKPNAVLAIRGFNLEFRAIAPILIGEAITLSYINAHVGKKERQRILLERYNIECHCEVCDSDLDAKVDFKKLDSMTESLERCTEDVKFARSFPQDRLLAKHERMMEMFRKMYNEFDDRISGHYTKIVAALLANNNYKTIGMTNKMKSVVDNARTHLIITLGADHPDYLRFESQFTQVVKQPRNRPTSKPKVKLATSTSGTSTPQDLLEPGAVSATKSNLEALPPDEVTGDSKK